MTTYEIIYNKTTYYLTLDAEGEVYDILYAPPYGGPLRNAEINSLPPWLINKARVWWQANNERIDNAM